MKKLLALLLILCMASTASAALTWNVDSITIDVDDTSVVVLTTSTGMFGGGPAWIGNDSPIAHISSVTGPDNPSITIVPWFWTVGPSPAGSQWDVTITGDSTGSYTFASDFYGSDGANDILTVTVVPEPISLLLLGLGILTLRRKHRL
jgi:hypothetical protein